MRRLQALSVFGDRLAWLILNGDPFTADDLTNNGAVALDTSHSANAGQSAIGTLFSWARRERLIEWNGHVVNSRSKYRHSSMIREWLPTQRGRQWAIDHASMAKEWPPANIANQ